MFLLKFMKYWLYQLKLIHDDDEKEKNTNHMNWYQQSIIIIYWNYYTYLDNFNSSLGSTNILS